MLKESKTNEDFEYQRLSPEEQKSRGILGRLVGVCADFIHPTRNGRKYSEKLWENVFNDPIMKEKIANRCCFGELGHPADRTETDMSKIAICLAEQPTKGTDGKLRAIFDILDTPNGRILKSLCDYGCNIGVSSRGEGDLVTDYNGDEAVDPETYSCECWDAVLIPAVKEARMSYVTESLDKKRYNKTLRKSLQESLDKASEEDRKIMEETLENLQIDLTESSKSEVAITEEAISEETVNEMADAYEIIISAKDMTTGSLTGKWQLGDRASAFNFVNSHPETDYAIMYRRFINGNFDSEQILARRATDQDIDNYSKSNKKVNIYVDGEWMPKGTNPADLKQDVANGSVVLVGFGSKITEALSEDEIATLNECLNLSKHRLDEDYKSIDNDPRIDDYKWLTQVEGKSPDEAWEIISSYNYADDDDLYESFSTVKKLNPEEIEAEKAINNPKFIPGESEPFAAEKEKAHQAFEKSINQDIENESLNINEETETVAVDNNEAIVEELQESLKAKADLEQKVIELQEKLSVCYAKEAQNEEKTAGYKTTVKKLAESAKVVKALQAKASALELKLKEAAQQNELLNTQLKESRDRVKVASEKSISLKENLSNRDTEARKLSESISKLSAEIKQVKAISVKEKAELTESFNKEKAAIEKEKANLTEQFNKLQEQNNLQKTEYSQKLEKSNKLIEKYKKATATAVDKYIELQAIRLGSSVNEIKNRLPESYSFKDIDDVCEEVQDYNLSMSKLPISTLARKSVNENIKIKGTSSKNESILPAVHGFDDDVDDDLMYLAGK